MRTRRTLRRTITQLTHRQVFLGVLLALSLLLVACQGPPPTQYVIVVTATPDAPTIEPEREPTDEPTDAPTDAPTEAPTDAPTNAPTQTAATEATNGRPSALPTATTAQIQVAEQRFQNGTMFWLQPTGQIWVLVESGDNDGVWTVYEDRFQEGDPEFDPNITPPSDDLLQPIRGFGLVWRDNQDVRDSLGWALEPELGHVTDYEYQTEGEIVDGEFVPEPGYHFLTSFYGDVYRFNEVNGTWQTITSRNNGG